MAQRTDILDLSHHNDVKSFEQIAASGVLGVILKASEGTSYEDPTFAQRYYEAQSCGLTVASYHFLHAGNITRQMEWYLEVVQPSQGERVVIDHEADASLKELTEAFVCLHDLRPDLQLTLYSGHLIKEQLDGSHNIILAQTALWIAQYTTSSQPDWPRDTWPNYSLWQWTDQATCQGVVGPVDANQFNGSQENCLKWMGPAQPAPPPSEQIVDIACTVPDGVMVKVSVNGQVVW